MTKLKLWLQHVMVLGKLAKSTSYIAFLFFHKVVYVLNLPCVMVTSASFDGKSRHFVDKLALFMNNCPLIMPFCKNLVTLTLSFGLFL